jgi:hypothetical protein
VVAVAPSRDQLISSRDRVTPWADPASGIKDDFPTHGSGKIAGKPSPAYS